MKTDFEIGNKTAKNSDNSTPTKSTNNAADMVSTGAVITRKQNRKTLITIEM